MASLSAVTVVQCPSIDFDTPTYGSTFLQIQLDSTHVSGDSQTSIPEINISYITPRKDPKEDPRDTDAVNRTLDSIVGFTKKDCAANSVQPKGPVVPYEEDQVIDLEVDELEEIESEISHSRSLEEQNAAPVNGSLSCNYCQKVLQLA